MSTILMPKTFLDLENFFKDRLLIKNGRRIILSERETFPVYKIKISGKGTSLTPLFASLYTKYESYDEDYKELFKIRFMDYQRGIKSYQVGLFYMPEIYEHGDPRNEFVPALIFDKDKSIYDEGYTNYFNDGIILQDLLIKLLNEKGEIKDG